MKYAKCASVYLRREVRNWDFSKNTFPSNCYSKSTNINTAKIIWTNQMFSIQLTIGLGLHSAHVRSLKEDRITEFEMTASYLIK